MWTGVHPGPRDRPSTVAGELFFHIFGALTQFERSIIRERTHAGLKAALARGRKGARASKPTANLRMFSGGHGDRLVKGETEQRDKQQGRESPVLAGRRSPRSSPPTAITMKTRREAGQTGRVPG